MTRAAFERLLRDEPPDPGERPLVRGDRAAVAILKGWTDRARGAASARRSAVARHKAAAASGRDPGASGAVRDREGAGLAAPQVIEQRRAG
jgi:hypothetical protein